MSNDSPNSPEGTTKTMTDLTAIEEVLKEKGVDLDRLAVVTILGAEQLVGEVHGLPTKQLTEGVIYLTNPKRLIPLRKVSQDMSKVMIDHFVGGFDVFEEDGSEIQLKAVAGYWVKDLKPGSKLAVLRLLGQYYQVQSVNRALNAGLALPGHMTRGG